MAGRGKAERDVAEVDVQTRPEADGWRCEVTIRERGSETRHSVMVSRADLEGLAPGDGDPERLVRVSFAFLLEREPKESILRSFALPVIGRYFPEYGREIRRRVGG